MTVETKRTLYSLAVAGYPLLPWSLEAAEDFGLFLADPQPSEDELRMIIAEVKAEKKLCRVRRGA
jgi:hypothetical protein